MTDPLNADAAAGAVEAALLEGDGARAQALAATLPAIPLGAASLAQRAVNLARAGRREDALALCRLAMRIAPGDGIALGVAAYVFVSLKMPDEAIGTALEAIRLEPGFFRGHTAAFTVMGMITRPDSLLPVLNRWAGCFGHPGDVPRALIDLWTRFARCPERGLFRHVANVFLTLGAADRAVEAYSMSLDPPDGGDPAHVRAIHADIARKYDANALHRDIVERVLALASAHRTGEVAAALDLCCGTGLAGPGLRRFAGRVVGVDMTSAMLAEAGAKNAYDRLEESDAVGWLAREDERYDLAIIADAMQYFRHVEPLFSGVGRVLKPGGLFVFSCDPATDEVGCGQSARGEYAHSSGLLRTVAASAGLSERHMEVAIHRGHPGFYGVFGK